MVIDDVAIVKVEVVGCNHLAALAILADGNHLAVGISDAVHSAARLDGGVGVGTDDQVNIMALADDERVVRLGGLVAAVANVRHHHDIIYAQNLLEVACRSVGNTRRIAVAQTTAVHIGNQTLGVDIDADKRNALVAHGLNPIGLEQTIERGGADVVVGTDFHGIDIVVVGCKFFHAVVKLMVAQNDGVIA